MANKFFIKAFSTINKAMDEALSLFEADNQNSTSYQLDNDMVEIIQGELAPGAIAFDSNGEKFLPGEYHLKDDSSLVRIDELGVVTEYVKAPAKVEQKEKPIITIVENGEVKQKEIGTLDDQFDFLLPKTQFQLEKEQILAAQNEMKTSVEALSKKIIDLETELSNQKAINEKLQNDVNVIGNSSSASPVVLTDQAQTQKTITDPFEKDRLFNQMAAERQKMFSTKK